MLGETANIRCAKIPYFQILVLLEELPYYKNSGEIGRMEEVNEHNLGKYIALSKDDSDLYFHTPIKTLLCIAKLPRAGNLSDKREYAEFYKNKSVSLSDKFDNLFGGGIIVNDFEKFADKVSHYIKSL